ncbi:MAG: hypothetical protein ACI9W4_002527 [Rhodothermales bacterium]
MRRTSLILVLALGWALGWAPMAAAQTVAVVSSNDPGAHVYADSTWLGTASRDVFSLPAGTRVVRVVPSAIASWGIPSVRAAVGRSDTLFVEALFPYAYRLDATPLKADVFLESASGRERLGSTPVVLTVDERLVGTFQFERTGFATVELVPGEAFWNRHQAVMQPLVADAALHPGVRLDVAKKRRKWIDYTALAVAAVGGAMAVHYKSEADKRFDIYTVNGDPALRPGIERMDNRSAVALGAMQTGIGVFALRLVFGR